MEEDVELADRFLAAYWQISVDHQNVKNSSSHQTLNVNRFFKLTNSIASTGTFFFCSKLAGDY